MGWTRGAERGAGTGMEERAGRDVATLRRRWSVDVVYEVYGVVALSLSGRRSGGAKQQRGGSCEKFWEGAREWMTQRNAKPTSYRTNDLAVPSRRPRPKEDMKEARSRPTA